MLIEEWSLFFSSIRPESQGVIAGCVYLVNLFFFIPVQFGFLSGVSSDQSIGKDVVQYEQVSWIQNDYSFDYFVCSLYSSLPVYFLFAACCSLDLPTMFSIFDGEPN